MDKFYLLQASLPFHRDAIFAILSETGVDTRTIRFLSPTQMEWKAPSSYYAELHRVFSYFRGIALAQVSVLIAHAHTEFEERLLGAALAYFPNAASFPDEVIRKEIGYDNFASYQPIIDLFRPIAKDEELLEAAKTYLACGLDACLAARSLFVHRNTFSYRLNAFFAKTGVDLRDYHNAQLFDIYLQFRGTR